MGFLCFFDETDNFPDDFWEVWSLSEAMDFANLYTENLLVAKSTKHRQ